LKNLRRGLEYAIILHIVLILSYTIISYINSLNAENIGEKQKTPIIINPLDIDIPPSINDNETIVTEIDEVSSKLKDLEALQPIPVAKNIAEILTTKTQDELDRITTKVSHEGDSLVADVNGYNTLIDDNIIKDKIDKNISNDMNIDKNFEAFEVEVEPVCVNLDWIKDAMVYPRVAVEAGIEDRVFVKVLVGTDGKVIKVGSIKGHEAFHDEVMQKAKDLEFTTGLQNGKPVKVWVTVPFKFKLEN
jgi:TonB family protein